MWIWVAQCMLSVPCTATGSGCSCIVSSVQDPAQCTHHNPPLTGRGLGYVPARMPHPGRPGRVGFGRGSPAACTILLWQKQRLWIKAIWKKKEKNTPKNRTMKQTPPTQHLDKWYQNTWGLKHIFFSFLPIAQVCSSWQPTLLTAHYPLHLLLPDRQSHTSCFLPLLLTPYFP